MDWQDAYKCFEYIVEKHNANEELIEQDVTRLMTVLKGFEPFDKAYTRWTEVNEDT